MNITKEMLQLQIDEYSRRRQDLINNLNALSGAIDDCGIWMKVLDAEEAEVADDRPEDN